MKVPYGICMRVVTSVLKPKPLIMMVPKLDMPPFGIFPAEVSVHAVEGKPVWGLVDDG
jgi:hypothetical protein